MTETPEQRRERLARAVFAHDLVRSGYPDVDPDEAWSGAANMPLSGPGFVSHWLSLADAIIASDEAAGVVCVPVEMVKAARDRVGPWLSAAMDDPGVCAEMKADITALFNAMPMPEDGEE